MPRTVENRRGWQRRKAVATLTPDQIAENIADRQFRDLETCRRVWTEEQDPTSILSAITHTDLPEWLSDAILAMLFASGGPPKYDPFRRLWERQGQQEIDGYRARLLGLVRAESKVPWESAQEVAALAAHRFRKHTQPLVSGAAIKRSYHKVRLALPRHKSRYYSPTSEAALRLREANDRVWTLLGLDEPRK
jgi:hypothetical protein